MKDAIKNYTEQNLITFSINIKQKKHKNGSWKKDINFPLNWTNFTLDATYFNKSYNGIAILTGKINNLIVIDIDNVEHWIQLLKENNQIEPDTVKVTSGSGGIHYYFQYDAELEDIKSKDHCFSKDYDIDIKTNGGCVIAPPTSYKNNNLNKFVEYKWNKSIFDTQPSNIPNWIKDLLLEKKTQKQIQNIPNIPNIQNIKKEIKKDEKEHVELQMLEIQEIQEMQEDNALQFTMNDIESLLNMLNESRYNNYNDWINIGMCLFNINKQYLILWLKWSQQSHKYEEAACEKKWKTFKREKNGLKIGSLLLWAKNDNSQKYDELMKKKKMNLMISSKYPNEKLILGETQKINECNYYTYLKNKECLIKGAEHPDMANSMYIDMVDRFMTIRCRHNECFGKTYPCKHVLMTKNEMNIALHGDINITINNGHDDEELVEFQKIDIYDDPKLNELVYNSLNGKSSQFAEIIYYFYENDYIYGEDGNWYVYKNHKWKNLGKSNDDMRYILQPKLKKIYSELWVYCKENNYDKQKIKSVRTIMNSFGDTNLKNNIMTELMNIYTVNKNPDRDFTQKLNTNNYLIGFNNGIYDLQKFEFRKGYNDDYISMSVGYDYQEQHTEKYNDLIKFLADIQPHKEEREYMLTYLSIGLIGNLLELFTIFTGSGRNGKSKLVDLIELTFGEYWGTVSSSLFTRKRPDANSPDPGLLSLANKRLITSSEPEKKESLNSGFIKFLTGKDSTSLRNCHSNEIVKFKPKFVTIFICNDIPDCDEIDKAFSKRLRCIHFPTEFVNEPRQENQKMVDVNINTNFKYWKLDFMLLLIEYYKKYIETHRLNATEKILKWTNQYEENTDLYLQFLNEYVEETNDDKDRIHCFVLYNHFKEWFKMKNPNSKIPSDKEFGRNLRKYKQVEEGLRIEDKVRIGIKKNKLKNVD
jgi:P4 family phage/plasmid primase-like protien